VKQTIGQITASLVTGFSLDRTGLRRPVPVSVDQYRFRVSTKKTVAFSNDDVGICTLV